jgi:hypothetical protein
MKSNNSDDNISFSNIDRKRFILMSNDNIVDKYIRLGRFIKNMGIDNNIIDDDLHFYNNINKYDNNRYKNDNCKINKLYHITDNLNNITNDDMNVFCYILICCKHLINDKDLRFDVIYPIIRHIYYAQYLAIMFCDNISDIYVNKNELRNNKFIHYIYKMMLSTIQR